MKKRNKILIIVSSVIVVLLAIIQFYANSVVKKFIENELSVFIEEQKENYHIEVGDVKVQLLLKRFSIGNVKFETHDSIPFEDKASFTISIDKIVVKLKTFSTVYNEGILTLKSIELEKPKITLIRSIVPDSTLKNPKDKFESKQLNEVILSLLKVDHGDVFIYEYNGDNTNLIASSSDLDFLLRDIHFQDNEEEIRDKISYTDLSLSTSELNYLKLSKHDFSIKGLRYSNIENEIEIEDFILQNRQDKSDFESQTNHNESWEKIHATTILLRMDLTKVKENKFFFKHINIGNFDLDFVKSKGEQDTSTMQLSEILSKIKAPFSIDTLRIKDGIIDLSFMNDNNEDKDDYNLNKLSLNCYHLSNDSLYTDLNPSIEADVKATLWKEGFLNARYAYQYQKEFSSASLNIGAVPKSILKRILLKNNIGLLRKAAIDNIFIDYSSDSSHIEGSVKVDISGVDMDYTSFATDSKWSKMSVSLNKLHLNSTFSKEKNAITDLFIDTLSLESPKIILSQKAKEVSNNKAPPKSENKEAGLLLNANLISLDNASFMYQIEGEEHPVLSIEKISLKDKGLSLDLREKGKDVLKNMGIFSIELKTTSLYKGDLNYLTLNNTLIENINNKIKVTGVRFKNITSKENFHKSSKEGNTWNSAYIEEVSMTSDLSLLLKNEFICDNVKLVRPILTHIEAIDRKKETPSEKAGKEFDFPITIKNLTVIDADVDFRIKTKEVKEFEVFDLSKLNGKLKNIVLNAKNKEKSKMSGSFTSSFYDLSKLNIEIQMEQGVKDPKTSIKGDASSLSLLTLKNKLSLIKDLNYSDGKIEKLNFDLINFKNKTSGDITFDKLSIDDLMLSSDKKGDYILFNLDELKLSFSKEKEGKLHITDAIVRKPKVEIHSIIKTKSAGSSVKDRKDLFTDENLFNPVSHIDKIKIIDGEIEEFSGIGTEKHLFSIENINLDGKKVIIYDSTNTTLPISIKDLDFMMKNIKVHSFPLFELTIESFKMNKLSQKAYLKNLELINKKTQEAFFKDLDYRKAWTMVIVPSMEFDMGLNEFFAIHPRIKKIIVDKVYFKSVGDLAVPVAKKEKPFPNRLLAISTFPITVDSILIKNSRMDIEFIDAGNKYGLLQFNKVNGSVSNLTTDKEAIRKNDEMKWKMDATLWESGDFHAEVAFKLDSKKDEFSMTGSMDNFNLIESDTLTKGLYSISVNSGFLHHSTFELEGDNDQASGSVSFDYDELRVNLDKKKKNIKSPEELKRIKRKDKLNESFVKNVIVNGLLSKDNMPENRNYIPLAEASYEREKNKSFFHLMWYTISSGLIEIVEAGMVKDIKNINEFFKKKKKEED